MIVAIGVFLYMSFQIGVWRLDTIRYNNYILYFYDISGLSKKADVRIAGVKIGWVDDLTLVNNGQQVRASIMVLKDYVLYKDAYGIVRQDGLLGVKYLEIIPGDPLLPTIKSGNILMKPSRDPVAVDKILDDFKVVANNLESATDSLKNVFGGDSGVQRLENIVNGFNQATENIASFANSMDRVVIQNEEAFDGIMTDLRDFSRDLKNEFPGISTDVRDGVNRVSNSIESAVKPIEEVADKINRGEGVIGKLVSDEEVSEDFKNALSGVKKYFEKIDQFKIIIDPHVETMFRNANNLDFNDGKGYFNVRIHPCDDYFYFLGAMASYTGVVTRDHEFRKFFDSEGNELNPDNLDLLERKIEHAPRQEYVWRDLYGILYNAQIGKIYGDIAFRAGIFDSTFGVAVDWDIPFNSELFRWVTSFEAFDFFGRNRVYDDNAHFKWINRLFVSKNVYFTFGADDFMSDTNSSAFFGAGIRFVDDDMKYLVSVLR